MRRYFQRAITLAQGSEQDHTRLIRDLTVSEIALETTQAVKCKSACLFVPLNQCVRHNDSSPNQTPPKILFNLLDVEQQRLAFTSLFKCGRNTTNSADRAGRFCPKTPHNAWPSRACAMVR